MRIGTLRHRIEIYDRDESESDSLGGQLVTWVLRATVWGSISPISGDESVAQQQVQDKTTHRVILRYRGDVTTRSQLRFRGRPFNVRAVLNKDERNVSLELLCEEGVAQ